MEKIASFTIDHIKLEPGVYVSERYRRLRSHHYIRSAHDFPNDEPVMNTAEGYTRSSILVPHF